MYITGSQLPLPLLPFNISQFISSPLRCGQNSRCSLQCPLRKRVWIRSKEHCTLSGWYSAQSPTGSQTQRRMAVLLLFLLSVQGLLLSTDAQESYSRLSETYKKGVDLALHKLHSHKGILHHFLFFRSITQSDIQPGFDVSYIYHHFYLKATSCPKEAHDSTACTFRNDRPLIDCAVCYKTYGENIEPEPQPYVHCIHKPTLTEEMKTERINRCNDIGYNSGAPTLLATTGD